MSWKFYFSRTKTSWSIALHYKKGWTDLTVHNIWAVARHKADNQRTWFFGPVMLNIYTEKE